MIAWLLDLILGPRCILCGQHVYPRDLAGHRWLEHGDAP